MTTIGSLFSGYGGLDMGVQLALGTMRTAWVSDIEPGPNKILAERFPDAPNLGDITTIDWDQVEPVDIITGGSPCQDLSLAGARAGMKPGTRSGLWESMTHAIEQLQPRLVVWENVQGALSAKAFSESDRSDSERHRLCVCGGIDRRGGEHSHRRDEGEVVRPENGPRDDEASSKRYDGTSSRVRRDPSDHAPSYREMGGGMDVLRSRGGLREASAGRDSVFENQETSRRVGHPSKRDQEGTATADEWTVSVDGSGAGKVPKNQTGGQGAQSQGSRGHCGKCGGCLNEPCADSNMGFFEGLVDERAAAQRPTKEKGQPLRALGRVLGDLANLGYDAEWTTVRASDVGAPHRRERVFVVAYPSGERLERYWPQRTQEEHAVVGSDPVLLPQATQRWGDYAPAIKRWEQVLGRPAPAPTQPSRSGKPQLSPRFVEFLMGLPQGWVTDTDTTRAQQLRALGNGVVPQQAAYALTEIIN